MKTPELSLLMFGLNGGRICLDCWGFVFVFGRVITSQYILLRYYELIVYVFHFPIPSHQFSIILICVKHVLFASFSSSIAIDKRVILITIA